MLESLHKRSGSWGVKIILAMIVIVFIFWGVGSLDSGSKNVLATVDGKPVSIPDFSRRLHQERERLRAANPELTADVLDKIGFRRQVLQEMIAETLLAQELARLEIVISPAELKKAIVAVPQFSGEDGKFSPEKYAELLKSQGLTPAAYEALVSEDLLKNKLAAFLRQAVAVSEEQARAYFDYAAEQRSMDYVLFPESAYVETTRPPEDELRAWYDGHQDIFMKPAEIDVDYIAITPDLVDEKDDPEQARFQKTVDDVLEDILSGKSLAESAVARNLKVESAAGLTKENAIGRLALEPADMEALFLSPVGAPADRLFSHKDGYLVAMVTAERPAHVQPYADVREAVLEAVRREKALAAARQAAQKAVQELREGKGVDAFTIVTTDLFGRDGLIPERGPMPEVAQAIFSADSREWLEMPFDTPDGAMIVRLRERHVPTEAEWRPLALAIQQGLTQAREAQAYRALVQALWEKADIKVRMPELLKENPEE